MFDESKGSIPFKSNNLGSYLGGFKGLALYSGLSRAFLQSNKKHGRKFEEYPDFYSLKNFNQLLPEPLFHNVDTVAKTFGFSESNKQSFAKYNKKMVKLLHQQFIPSPTDSIDNFKYQTLYSIVFKRFGRNLTSAYIHLKRSGFRKETLEYKRIIQKTDSNCLKYLKEKYKSVRPAVETSFSFSEMTPPIAIGFWLRRNMDGTRKEFWKGLSKVMYQYDKEWFIQQCD